MKAFLQRAVMATVMLLATIMARAYSFEVDGITYNTTSDTEVEVIANGLNYSGDIVIPESVSISGKTYKVTSIDSGAFDNCIWVTSVIMGESVTTIKDWAFGNCVGLTAIKIPDSVTSIGEFAFFGCSELETVELGESVNSIGERAFDECKKIVTITVSNPTPPTVINEVQFFNNYSKSTLYVPIVSLEAYRNTSPWKKWKKIKPIGGTGASIQADIEVDGIFYNIISPKEVSVTFKNSQEHIYSGDMVIPSTIEYSGSTFNVTSIGTGAFCHCLGLTSIVIPNSVATIGENAFGECPELVSVVLSDGLTNISKYAFFLCKKLTSIEIPNTVVSIGNYALYSTNISSIVIPPSVTSIGEEIFAFCHQLKSVELSNSITSITDGTFMDCQALESVVIPNSVISIGDNAFRQCKSIDNIEIPNSVATIGTGAFVICDSLKSITVAEGNQHYSSVNGMLFNKEQTELIQCPGGKSGTIIVPATVTSIGEMAFMYCSKITGVGIPASVREIKSSAFAYIYNVADFIIDNIVPPTVQDDSFDSSLYTSSTLYVPREAIEVYKNAEVWKNWTKIEAIGGDEPEIFEVDGIYYKKISETEVEVTYKSRGEHTYSGFVVIPSSITYLSKDYEVTSIGESAFEKCNKLIAIELGKSIRTIRDRAFIGCKYVRTFTVFSPIPPIIESDSVFENKDYPKYCTLHVPDDAIDAYKNANVWKDWPIIEPLSYDFEVDGIYYKKISDNNVKVSYRIISEDESFYTGDIIIPSEVIYMTNTYNVTAIGEYAFYYCMDITSIKLPNTISYIGSNAFNYCSKLKSIELPNTVTTIEDSAFQSCRAFTSFKIPESVTYIGFWAFRRCEYLTTIEIPNSVTFVGSQAFTQCSRLKSAKISDSVKSIHNGTFSNCSYLTSVIIGEAVDSIDNDSFKWCKMLNEIMVLNPVPPVLRQNSFDDIYSTSTLYVPRESIEAYRNADIWKNWAKIEVIPYDFEEDDVYYNIISDTEVEVTYKNLEDGGYTGDITIPSTITYMSKTYAVSSIGENAFANCNGITSVEIPASVTSIGKNAFANCAALTTVKVAYSEDSPAKIISANSQEGASDISIGESAFEGCSVLSTIYLGSSVTSISHTAFAGCHRVASITVLATEPPAAYEDSIDSDVYSTSILNVPAISCDLYKSAPVWCNWTTINAIGGSGIGDLIENKEVKIETGADAITVSGAQGGVCRILDLRGMEVVSRTGMSAHEIFTVKSPELYIVQVRTDNGKNIIRKVMVK